MLPKSGAPSQGSVTTGLIAGGQPAPSLRGMLVGLAARSPSLITDSVAYQLVPQCEAKTVRYECLRVARGLVTAVPTDRPGRGARVAATASEEA